MVVDNVLKKLAKEIKKQGHTLYIVGGYVRDSILNLESTDIDIASSIDTDTLCDICEKLELKTTLINKKLGTVQIKHKNNTYEYTRFRKESYSDNKHSPDSVEFVSDISTDALRRDITINSIYYNILEDSLIDLVCGIPDLQKNIIRTSNTPSITLNDDGLRILRLIRFASIYNFSIEKKTLKSLIANTPKLKTISAERRLNEIKQCVVADLKFNNTNTRFLQLLNKTKSLSYIFNSTLKHMSKISKYDLAHFYTLNHDARLIGFYILILKTFFKGFVKNDHLAYYINSLLGLDGLKESGENIRLTEKLYRVYQNLNFGLDVVNATINYLCLSDTERTIVVAFLTDKAKSALDENIAYIKSKKIPLGVHELRIDPEDLINAGIENKYISKILSILYNQVMECKLKNDLPDLLEFAKNIDKTFKEQVSKK